MERSWKHHVCFFTRILTVLKIYVNLYKYRATATWKIHGKNHPECRSRRLNGFLKNAVRSAPFVNQALLPATTFDEELGKMKVGKGSKTPELVNLKLLLVFFKTKSLFGAFLIWEIYVDSWSWCENHRITLLLIMAGHYGYWNWKVNSLQVQCHLSRCLCFRES